MEDICTEGLVMIKKKADNFLHSKEMKNNQRYKELKVKRFSHKVIT